MRHTDPAYPAAPYCIHRHMSGCKPGMWLANLGQALGADWPDAHIHAHCVVDDFGALQPVHFVGLTATGEVVR